MQAVTSTRLMTRKKICIHNQSLNWAKKVKILLFQEKKMKCSSVALGTEPINIYKDKQQYQKLLFQSTIKFYDKRILASHLISLKPLQNC
jgi:hypothetical protein